VLTQEIIIYLGLLIKSEPTLVKGLLTLRVGYLILLLTSELAIELGSTQDAAYEKLMELSPFEIQTRLHQVLTDYQGLGNTVFQQESLHLNQSQNQMLSMPLQIVLLQYRLTGDINAKKMDRSPVSNEISIRVSGDYSNIVKV
jgi:hypothetical protein